MFLQLPFDFSVSAQHLLLVLNTILLIGLLVSMEFAYSDAPAAGRRQLKMFMPLIFVIVSMLLYAVLNQSGSA